MYTYEIQKTNFFKTNAFLHHLQERASRELFSSSGEEGANQFSNAFLELSRSLSLLLPKQIVKLNSMVMMLMKIFWCVRRSDVALLVDSIRNQGLD